MSIKALQDYTYYAKYARYNEKEKRRETWAEAIDRVIEMHLRRYPQMKEEIEWIRPLMKEKRFLGSQRALQYGGAPIEKSHARMFNCCASYCDRIRFFQEAFWLLLCGCGAGFSVQQHHIAKLPSFSPNIRTNKKTYVVPDTIEGWADSLGVLLATYFDFPEFSEYKDSYVEFDFSSIRPKGSPLSSGIGKAPGYEPLKNTLEKIRTILDRCVKYKRLRPIDAYDIVMHASDAVLSGGIRRSATICIFSPNDNDMLKAKTGNWFYENPQRGRSNNSVLLVRDETTREQFESIIENVKQFGEPGFIFADNKDENFNPCVTKDTIVATDNGLRMVKDLIEKPFNALVNGKSYKSKTGFVKTGNKPILKLMFKSGRELKVTENHQILTPDGWEKAININIDENVVIHDHRDKDLTVNFSSEEYAQGYCLGSLIGDGNRSNNSCELRWWGQNREKYRSEIIEIFKQAKFFSNHHKSTSFSNKNYCSISSTRLMNLAIKKECLSNIDREYKTLSKKSICENFSYLSGLISGYFDADGTVAVNFIKGNSLRITSNNLENLKNVQIVLNLFGIFSTIYQNRIKAGLRQLPDSNRNLKYYPCKTIHEICISKENIFRFYKFFKLQNTDKANKLNTIINSFQRQPNKQVFLDKLIHKELLNNEDVYDCTVEDIHAFDANGVYVHNCVEVSLYCYDENGNSGWEKCNLCEINGRKIKTIEDFRIAAKGAAILGTLQAGYTDFPYLGPISESIVRREALLGVSITGMMDSPEILFNPEIQREMAELIKVTNKEIAAKININPSARTTCIKPSGSAACVLGTASGIHPHHAKRYFRRVQANQLEPILQHFKRVNPLAIEKSVWSANNTDDIVTFCVEVPPGAKTKNDLSAVELLEYVRLTQQNWVTYGRDVDLCVQPWLNHNVSNTINVRENEWDTVTKYIYDNRKDFAGVSLLPSSGDLDYPQAPMVNILTHKEIIHEYGEGALFASGLIVDGLHVFDNLWEACDIVLGRNPLVEPEENTKEYIIHYNKQDWIRRVKQFAERYCEGDLMKCTRLLKHVHNWKMWVDLKREYKDVDYLTLIEETNNVKLNETVACAGGTCELHF